MAHLDNLKISRRALGTRKSRRKAPLIEHSRTKLIANIEEQIQLAKLKIEGKPLELQRRRGRGIVTVRPKLWWEVAANGHVGTYILFNKIAINLGSGGQTIEVGPLKNLPKAYKTVIKAVRAGELDGELTKIAKGRKRPSK